MARILVTGLIAQHRWMGGVAWDYLNVLLGLKQLGHDVYYIEDSGEWPYQKGLTGEVALVRDPTQHVRYLSDTLSTFGLGECWAYRFPAKKTWFGLSDLARKELVNSADVLINVSGTLEHPLNYRAIPKLIYLDTDPVFTQIMLLSALSDRRSEPVADRKGLDHVETTREERLLRCVDAHDVHFTVGETLPDSLTATGHRWLPTKHPIALTEWTCPLATDGPYTTVANWASYAPVQFQGRQYGQKDIELHRILRLPAMVPEIQLEIALAEVQHKNWETPSLAGEHDWSTSFASPHELLRHHGWHVVMAEDCCHDYHSYRTYIMSGKGEFSVAKHGYVEAGSGWFSGRTACFLAAGRPAVVQDTGFSSVLPTGHGLLAFGCPTEAAAQLQAIENSYQQHAKAAIDLAHEYFDSAKVLNRMLELSASSRT